MPSVTCSRWLPTRAFFLVLGLQLNWTVWSDFGPSNPASRYSTQSSPRERSERSHREVGTSWTLQPFDFSHYPSYDLSPVAHEVHTPEAGKRFWSHCQLQKERKINVEKKISQRRCLRPRFYSQPLFKRPGPKSIVV